MPNQIKGTTTNLAKLAAWDIDYYLSLSDEETCLIELTERELYLLRNPLRQMKWSTRWTSEQGTPQPDRETIAENLAYKLSGDACMDLCQMIIDCINNPESGVANAITGLIGASDYESARNYGQSQNNLDMSSGSNPTCDKDILFGQAMQLVDYIDQLNTDLFEILEVASNYYDFFADVIGDVTGIDESSADAALAWVQFIQDSIAENYAAQVTVAYREELACEIFCAASDDCGITPTLLYNIMKDRLSSSISIEGVLWDVLSFLVDGAWSGSQIADFMFYSQFALRAMIGRYFDYFAWQDIYSRLAIYSNDPNPDWAILCDCVETWEYIIDFTLDSGAGDGWGQSSWGDGWFSGLGWRSEDYLGQQELNYLDCTFPQEATITRFEFTFASADASNFSAGTYGYLVGGYYLDAAWTECYRQLSSGLAINETYVMFNGSGTQMDMIRTPNNPYLSTGKWYIVGCTIRGTGANPFA